MLRKRFVFGLMLVGAIALAGTYRVGSRPKQAHLTNHFHLGAISGRVINANGEPVAMAMVYAERVGGSTGRLPTVLSDEQGNFTIKHLPAGIYNIHASKEEENYPDTSSAFHNEGLTTTPRVDLNGQQTTSYTLVQLAPKSGILSGRILDATTLKPILNAQITLRRLDNPEFTYRLGLTIPEEGKFNVPVPSTPITVEISAPGYKEWRLSDNSPIEELGSLQVAPSVTREFVMLLKRNK